MAKKKKSAKKQPELDGRAEPVRPHRLTNDVGAAAPPRSSLVKTCILFAVILAALHAFTWFFALKGYVKWGYGTAHIVSSILNGMGIQNTVDYNIIQLRNDTWNVTSECTAINAEFLFIAFVLAFSATVRSKALGLIAGIPLIVLVNIGRLVVLGWVTEYWPQQAHFFHDYVWETIFLFFIIALWFVWINVVVNREKTSAVSC
jgi:archaeosortase B (VPXXXP-CTERM-specific)